MVTEDHFQSTSKTALTGTLPGQRCHLGQCCASPAQPLPTPFSEIIPLGKPSRGVRSVSCWAVPRAVPEGECACGLPQCWQRPLCRGQWKVLGLLHWWNTWKQPSQSAVRAEEHHAWWELTGRGRPGKRRLQSTSSAKLTLFFPPLSFDIKQIEWENGRCRHN